MIIPRKYECLGILYDNDLKSKIVIDNAFAGMDLAQAKWLLRYNHDRIVARFDIGSGVPGEVYQVICKEFDALDKSDPYDNGFTFKQVTRIEYETSRKGTAIQMRFFHTAVEQPERIVGLVSLENRDGQFEIGKGWKMAEPML